MKKLNKQHKSLGFFDKVDFFRLREGKKVVKSFLLNFFDKSFVYKRKLGFGSGYDYVGVLGSCMGQIEAKLIKLSRRKEFNGMKVLGLASSKNFVLLMKLYVLELWFEFFVDGCGVGA